MEELIYNKSVAFVGLAPNIYEKDLGKEIDSFDVVIRTNIYPVPQKLHKDYGTKCGILSMLNRRRFFKNLEPFIKDGGKALFYYNPKFPVPKEIQSEFISNEKLRGYIKRELGGRDPKWPSAGVRICITCLKYKPKVFKFFGVTGYQNPDGTLIDTKKTEPYIHYEKHEIKTKRKPKRGHKCHNHEVLNDYLRKLLKENKIEMDEYSKEYFK